MARPSTCLYVNAHMRDGRKHPIISVARLSVVCSFVQFLSGFEQGSTCATNCKDTVSMTTSKNSCKFRYHRESISSNEIRGEKWCRNTDATWRTSQAVGVSESTITRILREERRATQAGTSEGIAHSIFKAPAKIKRDRPKSVRDDVDIAVVRKTVMSFQTEFNQQPTLGKLKPVLA